MPSGKPISAGPAFARGALRLLAIACLCFCARTIVAGEISMPEYQVKALFLFNFPKYVDWPAETFSSDTAPLTIGIIGDNKLREYLLGTVEGKSTGGHPVAIRAVKSSDDLLQCHILFIGSSEKTAGDLLQRIKDLPILTVGETNPFTELGGIISFLKKDGKIRLTINLNAAREAKLKIRSKLLNVADSVKGTP